jgi:uncharacterized protein (TIGR03437 family)
MTEQKKYDYNAVKIAERNQVGEATVHLLQQIKKLGNAGYRFATVFTLRSGSYVLMEQEGDAVGHPPHPQPQSPRYGAFFRPDLPVSVTVEGKPAEALYAGPAPGLVAGVMQIEILVPETASVAPFDQLVVTVGTLSSPGAVAAAAR